MASIVNIVKSSKLLYNLYYYVGSFAINILKKMLKADPKLIVFNGFGGDNYDDSPQAIYLAMINDKRFKEFKFVWAFKNPDKFSIPKGEKVKTDTFSFYKCVLKARVWVTNTTMTRALSFSGINTFSLNTWHGTAIKKIGKDASLGSAFVAKGSSDHSVFLGQGEYDQMVFSNAFGIVEDRIKIIGLPRNDELVCGDIIDRIRNLRKRFSIPEGKKVILYAPTFREYDRDGADCVMKLPIDLMKWEQELVNQYVLLIRAHHAVVKTMNIVDNDFIKDVSAYPHLNDLMVLSDMLISDYSSIFFDYSILGKPMLCFSYDYDRYEKERGMYFDIRKELDDECLDTEDKLLSAIINLDFEKRKKVTELFRDKYVQKYGTATNDSLDLIYNSINC